MPYKIEVNVARKGSIPAIWRTLVDGNDKPCVWMYESDARHALESEGRGDNARIVEFAVSTDNPEHPLHRKDKFESNIHKKR